MIHSESGDDGMHQRALEEFVLFSRDQCDVAWDTVKLRLGIVDTGQVRGE